MYKVLVFTLESCIHCKHLKDKLRENSIPFSEIEITQNPNLWAQVVSQTKNEYLPTFFIHKEGSNTGPVFCPEKDFVTPEDAMVIIDRYINKEVN